MLEDAVQTNLTWLQTKLRQSSVGELCKGSRAHVLEDALEDGMPTKLQQRETGRTCLRRRCKQA